LSKVASIVHHCYLTPCSWGWPKTSSTHNDETIKQWKNFWRYV